MTNTYTFTARSAADSRHVATFTLTDHQLAVNMGTALAEVGRTLEDGDEPEQELGIEQGLSMAKPAAAWLVQRTIRPFDIADVEADSPEDGLEVRAWVRAGGRRLAPITFHWQEIDNPEGGEAFAQEVERRKAQAERPGKYPGPLDYWATWVALGAVAGLFLLVGLRRLAGGDRENAAA
jgi:hypothetical protein